MNNPFDYRPDERCEAAFRRLVDYLDALKSSDRAEDAAFCRELEAGKMLGVLIAVDHAGEEHTLYAFSGQAGEAGFHHPRFVPPVFDYLTPGGYFKSKESDISQQSKKIALYERGPLNELKAELLSMKERLGREIDAWKARCRQSKLARDARRRAGAVDEAESAAMIRESQYEKAELRRLKQRVAAELEPIETRLQLAQDKLYAMKEKRKADSESLQTWLFTHFMLLNARGESHSLSDIFADTPLRIPPSGAGECCAPKLLQEAYRRGWHPVSIAEYWYGRPKGGEVRVHGHHYPACRGKCLPVLSRMLQGLQIEPHLGYESGTISAHAPEIVFENQWFCVVNKPGGMLSVPGKGAAVSLQQWLTERYGADRQVKMAHRLDRDTSGLIIATFDPATFKLMQTLFATRRVHKTYEAILEGDYERRGIPRSGRIELPLAPDWLDRPRQRVDFEAGKEAVTDYEFTAHNGRRSRVIFHPATGRTHQLRVHAASTLGLGMPIVGDPLYGSVSASERMHLHAQKIEFTFPTDGHHYTFEAGFGGEIW